MELFWDFFYSSLSDLFLYVNRYDLQILIAPREIFHYTSSQTLSCTSDHNHLAIERFGRKACEVIVKVDE